MQTMTIRRNAKCLNSAILPIKYNAIYNIDCMIGMRDLGDNSVDFTLTDIPYNAVNRADNGLRKLDKANADILTFEIDEFLNEVYRITKNSIVIFCGKEQFSQIYGFFAKQKARHALLFGKNLILAL